MYQGEVTFVNTALYIYDNICMPGTGDICLSWIVQVRLYLYTREWTNEITFGAQCVAQHASIHLYTRDGTREMVAVNLEEMTSVYPELYMWVDICAPGIELAR